VPRTKSSEVNAREDGSRGGGGPVGFHVGDCVAAAETVSRGDLGIDSGSRGRKGGSPPWSDSGSRLPGP